MRAGKIKVTAGIAASLAFTGALLVGANGTALGRRAAKDLDCPRKLLTTPENPNTNVYFISCTANGVTALYLSKKAVHFRTDDFTLVATSKPPVSLKD
jgi:hypothetical protein